MSASTRPFSPLARNVADLAAGRALSPREYRIRPRQARRGRVPHPRGSFPARKVSVATEPFSPVRVCCCRPRPGSCTVLAATQRACLRRGPQRHREYRIWSPLCASWPRCVSPGPLLGPAVLLAGYGNGWGFLVVAAPGRLAIWAEASAVLLFQSPGPGAFTVLDPGKPRLLPGQLPRWANPWTGLFSGAGTLRARGREPRREESR